jgi:hypothetical protein
MSTTVMLCKEDVALVFDRNSKGDQVVSEVESPAFADIIDTEQNVSAAAGAGAEVAVPNLDGGGAYVIYDHDNNNDSEQRSFS